MVYQLKNLISYLNACYAILYPKGMGSGIQAIDKTNELLSVITVNGNAFHNDAMAYTYYKFLKVLSQNLCGMCSFNGSNVSML